MLIRDRKNGQAGRRVVTVMCLLWQRYKKEGREREKMKREHWRKTESGDEALEEGERGEIKICLLTS